MTNTLEKIDSRGCSKCGKARHWTGSRWRCSPCHSVTQAKYRAQMPVEQAARYRAVRTATRHTWSPERRERTNAKITEWREANRDRHRAGARDWYWRNVEHARAKKLEEYRRNPQSFMARNLVRKARIKNAVCEHGSECVTSEFLAGLYAQTCLYCDSQAQHADHFEPLATGGLHCRDNLVPACGPCNASKKASDPWEWMSRRLT